MFAEGSTLAEADEIDFFGDLQGATYLSASRDTIDELAPFAEEAGLRLEYITPRTQLIQVRVLIEGNVFAAPLPSARRMGREGIAIRPLARYPLSSGRYTVFRDDAPDYVLDFARFLKEIDQDDRWECALRRRSDG